MHSHTTGLMRRYQRLMRSLALPFFTGATACGDSAGVVPPDPLRPERYQLQFVDNNSLPIVLIGGLGDDATLLDSAALIPYAVGRTLDRRLVNDRTGRGNTGGNARDTTVARGQFMDVKVIKQFTPSMGTTSYQRDSTLVDVEIHDTMVIVTRDHPGASQVKVDTGYFSGDLLVLNATMPTLMGQIYGRRMMMSYKLTR